MSFIPSFIVSLHAQPCLSISFFSFSAVEYTIFIYFGNLFRSYYYLYPGNRTILLYGADSFSCYCSTVGFDQKLRRYANLYFLNVTKTVGLHKNIRKLTDYEAGREKCFYQVIALQLFFYNRVIA